MPQIRARDLRDNVKTYGFERGMHITLEAILEERVQEREHMRELTALVAQCIDQVANMVQVGDAMKSKLEDVKRIIKQGEDHGHGNVQDGD